MGNAKTEGDETQHEDGAANGAPQMDAVLVIKQRDEKGEIVAAVQTMGAVEITEVQTLLEMGLNAFRDKAGLNRQR